MRYIMLESTVTSKGQTTLPKSVRDRLGLEPGDKVRYIIVGDEVRLVRPRKVATLCGALRRDGSAVSLDEMNEAVRMAAAKRRADRSSK